ncbi:MAG: chemotaxis protein CheW [Cyanobacteria bacterium J06632_22]
MATEGAMTTATATQAASQTRAESFLTVHLPPDTTALLAVDQMSEVLKVPLAQVTPIPHLPSWVLGVYNWRGEILWMVDLGGRVGLQPWHAQEMPPAVAPVAVIEAAQQRNGQSRLKVGLVVRRIEDIVTLDPDQLQSPPNALVTEQLAPFLRGHWLDPTGQMLTLLDGTALLDRMPS